MFAEIMKRQFDQFSYMKSGYSLIRDPNNLEEVLNMSNRLSDLATKEDIEKFAAELCKDKKAIAAIEKRYRVNPKDRHKLKKCKAGSLGWSYLKHLETNEISPESLTTPPVTDDFSYVIAHLYETHDIWHAVTGFNTDIAGELGLAAFGAAQLPSQFELILLAGGLLNTAYYNFDERVQRMDSIAQGWSMGKKAEKLFGIEWTKLWETPLSGIRKQLSIVAE